MKFHEMQGVNVEVDETRRMARRVCSFCDAFVFSEAPLRLNSMVAVRLQSPETQWAGHAFVGVTSKNPISFVEGANLKHITQLLAAEDVWIRPVQPAWASASLVLHLTYDGQLEVITDTEPNVRYCLLENLPVNFPLWLVVDIYGATNCVQLPTYSQPNSREIVALGSDVYATYKCGKEGVMPYNYAHIVLIGPKSAGKTTLKAVLASHQAEQQTETEADDEDDDAMAEPSRFYLAQEDSPWILLTSTGPNRVVLAPRARADIYHDLAANIVHEIVLNEREKQAAEMSSSSSSSANPSGGGSATSGQNSATSTRELIKTVLKLSGGKKTKKSYTQEVRKQLSDTTNEIPEELMFMIEEMLKDLTNDTDKSRAKATETVSVAPVVSDVVLDESSGAGLIAPGVAHRILHVSDFGGDMSYLVVNQFLFTSCAVYLFVFNLADSLDAQVDGSDCATLVSEYNRQPMSLLDTMHLWLSSLHATIAVFPTPNESLEMEPETGNNNGEADGETREDNIEPTRMTNNVQPQVVLVGTHRNAVHGEPIVRNQLIKEKFEKIFASFEGKPYASHLYRGDYIALDARDLSFDEPDLSNNLRRLVSELVVSEKVTGFNIPLPWLQLGQILEKLRQRDIYIVDINQLHEVASTQIDCFQAYDNLTAALRFYHNQARIFYLDCIGQHANEGRYSSFRGDDGSENGHDHQQSALGVSYELGVIILDPSWFMAAIYQLCQHIFLKTRQNNPADGHNRAGATSTRTSSLNEDEDGAGAGGGNVANDDDDHLAAGLISETIINQAWASCMDEKFILLGCLENLDIICELSPYIQLEDAPDVGATAMMPKLYFFPWIIKSMVSEAQQQANSSTTNTTAAEGLSNSSDLDDVGSTASGDNFNEATFQFVVIFNILPVALFTRLLIRLSKWSWAQGWGRRPEVVNMRTRIAVDFDHDIILKVNLAQSHISIVIVKIFDELQNDQIESLLIGPAANVCVKVQHLIESELETLRALYYRRLHFRLAVPCPCDATCERHLVDGCLEEECLHFLSLQDCLKRKVIECKYHRQVRTTFIQRYLPYAPNNADSVGNGPGGDMLFDTIYNMQGQGDVWDNLFQEEPLWMREAAKMLNNTGGGRLSNDWVALAKRLSYSERDVSKFADEVSPSLGILKDWYESNGRTRYCIDVLISCLRMLSRDDIASLIEYELEPETISPPIFISYHRDSQKQVLEIRRKLELSGFPCWMDTSSIGGGDSLYGKIYEGISRAKVFISCLTPRYVASPMCNREVTLADVLHKPILPLIIEFTPWPPPGAMALIMSSIVYIDMCGVGSHSGIGRAQDTESLFHDILDRVSRYISGYSEAPIVSSRYLQLPDLFMPHDPRDQHNLLTYEGGGGGHLHHQQQQQQRHRPHSPSGHGHNHSTSSRLNVVYRHRHLTRQATDASSALSSSTTNGRAALREVGPVSAEVMRLMEGSASRDGSHLGEGQQGPLALGEDGEEHGVRSPRVNLWSSNNREAATATPFADDIISGDNISVLSRSRMTNRITSCAVCSLM